MPISAADVKIVLSAQDNASPAVKQFGANAEKALRDVEGATGRLNGVFEKFKQNWLGLTAAAYAAKEAFQKAWDMAGVAADYNERIAALNAFGAQYGMTGTQIVNATKEASRGLISLANAADMAAIGMNLALSPQQVAEFTSVAEALSDVIGGSIPEAYDRMVVAAASGRTTTLAQMGILVDLDKAYKDHAEAIGRKAESLTSLEKQQIRVNTILETAKGKVANLGGSVDTTRDKMDRLVMTLQDIELWLGQATIKGAAMALSGFQYLAAGVLGLVSAYSRYRAMVYAAIGDEKKHQENLINANAAWEARNALLKDAANNWQLATTNSTTIASIRRTGNLPVDYEAPAGSGKTGKTTKSDIMTQAEKDAILVKDELERAQKVWEDNEEWLKTHVFDPLIGDYVLLADLEEAELKRKRLLQQVLEDIKTPAEKYNEQVDILNDLLSRGLLTTEQYERALEKARSAMEKSANDEKSMLDDLKQSIEGWGRDAADAITDWALEGKGSFKDFADAVIKDIMRMVLYQQLLKPIMTGISNGSWIGSAVSFVGGLFGSSGGTVTGTQYNADVAGSFTGGGLGFHTGGMANEPTFYRIGINPKYFEHAPRYHSGIGPNETAAILRKDEGVFTPGQMKALGLMANQGSTTISVPVTINGDADRRLSSRLQRAIEDTVQRELKRSL